MFIVLWLNKETLLACLLSSTDKVKIWNKQHWAQEIICTVNSSFSVQQDYTKRSHSL